MKKILFVIFAIAFTLLLHACIGDRAVVELVVTDGIKDSYELNEVPDFSGIKAVATYNDDTTVEIGIDKLTVSPLDTSTAGSKLIKITYEDYSIDIAVTVKGVSFDPARLSIISATLPDFIAKHNVAKESYINKNYCYAIGDDNPFVFRLNVTAISANGIPTSVSSYTSASHVYLEGSSTPLEGEELLSYVTVNEADNSFDFTDAAIGKRFVISTRPLEVEEGKEDKFTKSITVEVVDGYNIYQAYELNFITNSSGGFDFSDVFPDETRTQLQIVDDFLATEKQVSRPVGIAGIVLHNNFTLSRTDIPKEYFHNKDRNGDFHDYISIFNHECSDTEQNFTIYGNYFTISAFNLPPVVGEGVGNQDNIISNAQLLRFGSCVDKDIYYDHTKYSVTIRNLHLLSDNSTSTDTGRSEKALLGLYAIRTQYVALSLENTKLEAFLTSLSAEKDYQSISLNECKLTNAWQCHIHLISYNSIQEVGETPLDKEHYPRLSMNINNSIIKQSGGPAIVIQTDDPEESINKFAGPAVYISDDSTVESWVTGKEAWFKAFDIGISIDYVMNTIISSFGDALRTQNSTIFTEVAQQGSPFPEQKMNLVIVNLTVPDLSGGIGDAFIAIQEKIDIDGKVIVGDKEILNMDDYTYDGKEYNFKNPTLSNVKDKASASNLVVHTPNGGVAHTSPTNPIVVDEGNISASDQNNYITVFFYTIAIVFGNYHSTTGR